MTKVRWPASSLVVFYRQNPRRFLEVGDDFQADNGHALLLRDLNRDYGTGWVSALSCDAVGVTVAARAYLRAVRP